MYCSACLLSAIEATPIASDAATIATLIVVLVHLKIAVFALHIFVFFVNRSVNPRCMLASVVLLNMLDCLLYSSGSICWGFVVPCSILRSLPLTGLEKSLLVPQLTVAGLPLGSADVTELVLASALEEL